MEKKSYPEILHNICVEFGHGEKGRVDAFEKAIVLLIDQIVTDEKQKQIPIENHPKNEHYLKNDNIKNDCDSCSRHDIIVGCTLKHKNKCLVNDKYTKYRRGHLLPCDRCKTYSVVTKIDRIPDVNKDSIPRPAIKFLCLNCKDYPLINRGVFKGYELRGMEFTEKYIRMYKQKIEVKSEQDAQQKDSGQVQQKEQTKQKIEIKPEQDIQQKDSAEDIRQKIEEKPAQKIEIKPEQDIQTEPEIEVVAMSAE